MTSEGQGPDHPAPPQSERVGRSVIRRGDRRRIPDDKMDRLQDASDGSLVVAIGRWREDALAEAFRRHAGAVYALARRVLGDGTLAEEVVQEVFLKLWSAPERYDPARGSLRSFLLAQSHGRAVDLLRSNSSRRRREEREAAQSADAGYDIEREVWDLAVADQLQEAVKLLPPEERKAIELAYFGGHTYREVATMLSQPEGTVKSRIRSGLKRLRDLLGDAGLSPVVAE
ncbi:MAG: ECF RNA polymerase sigma factor SigK [Acidimicrobiales bacterium]